MKIEIEIPGGIPGDLGDLEVAFRSLRVVYNAGSQGVPVFSPERQRDMLECVVALEVMCYPHSSLHAAGPRPDVVAALSQRKLDMEHIERVLDDAIEELMYLFKKERQNYTDVVNARKDDAALSSQHDRRIGRISIALGSVACLQRICDMIQALSSPADSLAA